MRNSRSVRGSLGERSLRCLRGLPRCLDLFFRCLGEVGLLLVVFDFGVVSKA